MSTFSLSYTKAIVLGAILVLGLFALALPSVASASPATTTEAFQLEKKISDNITPNPYSPDDFSFQVTGNGYDELVTLGAPGGGLSTGNVDLPPGVYTVTEIGPSGFVAEDWTVQWSGFGCENKNSSDLFTTLTVTESDFSANVCRADNQWRPQTPAVPGCMDVVANNYDASATVDDGSCTYDPVPVPGCMDVTANNYNVLATTDDGSCTFDTPVNGCTDSGANNYNQYATVDDGSCTYDSSPQLYVIDGYVWHDVNEDGVIDDGEDRLENWGLTLVNGSTTFTGTSNAQGYFSFSVVAGTWTLSETVEDGWAQVYPTPVTYTIVVPDDLESSEVATLGFPLNLFFTVAHAQVVTSGGPYNFGNVFTGGGGSTTFTCSFSTSDTGVTAGDTVTLTWNMPTADTVSIDNGIGATTTTGTYDVVVATDITYILTATQASTTLDCPVSISAATSGGGSSSSGGTSGTKFDRSSNTADPVEPIPQVLGEQVTVIPAGAPNAGAGGTAPSKAVAVTISLVVLLASALGLRRLYRVVS